MTKEIKNNNKGFVILFAVTLSAILLSIALGVANIALKEIRFGTSAKDTNEAFFAADSGIEQVFFNDKGSSSLYVPPPGQTQTWTIVVLGLGSTGTGCANVSITKDNQTNPSITTTAIISKGYNNGGGAGTCVPGSNTVERELDSNY